MITTCTIRTSEPALSSMHVSQDCIIYRVASIVRLTSLYDLVLCLTSWLTRYRFPICAIVVDFFMQAVRSVIYYSRLDCLSCSRVYPWSLFYHNIRKIPWYLYTSMPSNHGRQSSAPPFSTQKKSRGSLSKQNILMYCQLTPIELEPLKNFVVV